MSDELGLRFGIDLGGSKIELIAFDAAGRERLRQRIANDANCFALSEATDCAAGAEVVFGVILGTGVGTGIMVRGRALDDPNGIAGELGAQSPPGPSRSPRSCSAHRATAARPAASRLSSPDPDWPTTIGCSRAQH